MDKLIQFRKLMSKNDARWIRGRWYIISNRYGRQVIHKEKPCLKLNSGVYAWEIGGTVYTGQLG